MSREDLNILYFKKSGGIDDKLPEIIKEIISLNITCDNANGKPFYVDELLIHRSENRLFRSAKRGNQEYIIYNNYWLRTDSFTKVP